MYNQIRLNSVRFAINALWPYFTVIIHCEAKSMLKLLNIRKSFAAQKVIEDFNLHLPRGLVFSLIGPSGCGKSTLLKLITGLLPSDGGTIEIDGQTLSKGTIQQLRHQIGYVIQEGGLFPHLTARTNISLLTRFLNWPTYKINQRLQELQELTHIKTELLERYPAQLSGGQRQRISLMRALMADPPLLLLDEPLGALDPLIRADLQNELLEIFRKLGKTVLLVTHDLREAAFFGDQIVLMNEGRIVQQGAFADLEQQPSDPFVKRFFAAQLQHGGVN